jgi:hypothetical protein
VAGVVRLDLAPRAAPFTHQLGGLRAHLLFGDKRSITAAAIDVVVVDST